MKVTTTVPADFQIRTLTDEQRPRILELVERLKNWEKDPHIRNRSRKLPKLDVYAITASNGMTIFFRKSEDEIQVVDIASKETIEMFANEE
jgi:hypothetical protein